MTANEFLKTLDPNDGSYGVEHLSDTNMKLLIHRISEDALSIPFGYSLVSSGLAEMAVSAAMPAIIEFYKLFPDIYDKHLIESGILEVPQGLKNLNIEQMKERLQPVSISSYKLKCKDSNLSYTNAIKKLRAELGIFESNQFDIYAGEKLYEKIKDNMPNTRGYLASEDNPDFLFIPSFEEYIVYVDEDIWERVGLESKYLADDWGDVWKTVGVTEPDDNISYPDLYTNGKYDRDAAVAYATNPDYTSPDKNGDSFLNWEKHTRKSNPAYMRFDSWEWYLAGHLSGSDCANFIAQAIFSGGVKQTDNFYYKEKEIIYNNYAVDYKEYDFSASWVRPQEQIDYLKENGYINGDIIEVKSPEEANNDILTYGIQKGDLIYLKNDAEGLHHAMIITKIENGRIYISAHSNDHIDMEYDDNFFQDGNIGIIVRLK